MHVCGCISPAHMSGCISLTCARVWVYLTHLCTCLGVPDSPVHMSVCTWLTCARVWVYLTHLCTCLGVSDSPVHMSGCTSLTCAHVWVYLTHLCTCLGVPHSPVHVSGCISLTCARAWVHFERKFLNIVFEVLMQCPRRVSFSRLKRRVVGRDPDVLEDISPPSSGSMTNSIGKQHKQATSWASFRWFHSCLTLQPWRWRHVPLKRRTVSELQDITNQNTVIFCRNIYSSENCFEKGLWSKTETHGLRASVWTSPCVLELSEQVAKGSVLPLSYICLTSFEMGAQIAKHNYTCSQSKRSELHCGRDMLDHNRRDNKMWSADPVTARASVSMSEVSCFHNGDGSVQVRGKQVKRSTTKRFLPLYWAISFLFLTMNGNFKKYRPTQYPYQCVR
jgi:hypothetical protein